MRRVDSQGSLCKVIQRYLLLSVLYFNAACYGEATGNTYRSYPSF